MDGILRRRDMMEIANVQPVAVQLFQGVSWGGRTTRGTLTQLGDGAFTMASTGSANWSFYQNPYGSADKFKSFSELKGHRVRFDFTVDEKVLASGASISLCCTLTSNTTTQQFSRTAYTDYVAFDVGDNTYYFDVPTDISGWGTVSGGADTDKFIYRFYLHGNSGTKIKVSSIAVYDMGVIS